MSQPVIAIDPASLDASADLQTILAAWHMATLRLEQTHDALRDEVRQLTAELEIKNRELARKNRLADLGQMASHVAHEVRNNLVPVTLYLGMLRRRLSGDAESLDMAAKIVAGFQAMDAMVNDLLHFTSDRDPQFSSFPLRGLAADIEAALAPQLAAQKIRFQLDVSPRHSLRADREMLRRAVLNLVLNALDVMPHGGTLTIGSTASSQRHGTARRRQRTGPARGRPAAGLRAVLHDQTGGHGPGTGHRLADCRGPRRRRSPRPTGPGGGAVFTLRFPRPPLESRGCATFRPAQEAA